MGGIVKDSRYCWFLVVVGHVNLSLWAGILNIFGVFFVEFLKEFEGTPSTIAWLGSGACGMNLALGPLASRLRFKFGDRVIITTATAICSLSMLISTFVKPWQLLFLTYTVCYGFGCSLLNISINNVPAQYFEKHLTTATGLLSSGNSFGIVLYSLSGQYMIDTVGWRNAWRLFAGLLALSALTGYLFKPPIDDNIPTASVSSPCASLPLHKNRVYLLWLAAVTLLMLGYYVPFIHIVSYAVEKGFDVKKSSWLITVIGASSAVGRLMIGKIASFRCLNRVHLHQMAMLTLGTATMMVPIISSYGLLVFYAVLVGLIDACHIVLLILLTGSFTGRKRVTTALGIIHGISSITSTLGPPIAGWIYEYTSSYSVPFHFAGVPSLVACGILFFIPWAQKTTVKTTKQQKIYSQLIQHDVQNEFNLLNGGITDTAAPYVEVTPEIVYNQEIFVDSKSNFPLDLGTNDAICNVKEDGDSNNVVSLTDNETPYKQETNGLIVQQHITADKGDEPNDSSNLTTAQANAYSNANYSDSPVPCVVIPDAAVEILEALAKKEDDELLLIPEKEQLQSNECKNLYETNVTSDLSSSGVVTTGDAKITSATVPPVVISHSVVNILEVLAKNNKDAALFKADGNECTPNNTDATFEYSNNLPSFLATTGFLLTNDTKNTVSVISDETRFSVCHGETNPSEPQFSVNKANGFVEPVGSQIFTPLVALSSNVEPGIASVNMAYTDQQSEISDQHISYTTRKNFDTEHALDTTDIRLSSQKSNEVANNTMYNNEILVEVSSENKTFYSEYKEPLLPNIQIPVSYPSTLTNDYAQNMCLPVTSEGTTSGSNDDNNFHPRIGGTRERNSLSMCIDENILFGQHVASKEESDIDLQEKVIPDISDLAAENLAEFEKDTGVTPVDHANDLNGNPLLYTQNIETSRTYPTVDAGQYITTQSVTKAACDVNFDNNSERSHLSLDTNWDIYMRSAVCSGKSLCSNATLSDLATENLAQFEEKLGIGTNLAVEKMNEINADETLTNTCQFLDEKITNNLLAQVSPKNAGNASEIVQNTIFESDKLHHIYSEINPSFSKTDTKNSCCTSRIDNIDTDNGEILGNIVEDDKISLSDLAAENIAQFEEDLGIIQESKNSLAESQDSKPLDVDIYEKSTDIFTLPQNLH